MGNRIGVMTFTFAAGATVSDALQLQDGVAILGLVAGSTVTTADLSLQVSPDVAERTGETPTFHPLYTSGGVALVGVTGAAANRAYRTDEIKGWFWVRLVASVAQAGGSTVRATVGKVY